MTSRRTDQFLLALGLILIFISSYQLFLWRVDGEKVGFNLAILEEARSVVKVKSFSALDWKDAYSGSGVADNQLIYTDEDSSVNVKFLQGHNITISENSLVRIKTSGMNVERGLIRARLQKDQPMVINVQGSELKLTGENADIQITTQGDKTEIGVISGEVSVDKAGQVENIDQTQSLKVSSTELEKQKVAFALSAPLQDEVIYTLLASHPVELKWTPSVSAEVLVSEEASFKKVTSFRGEGITQANLKPGTYYWKVEHAEGSSLTGSFHIVQEVAPVILRPLSQEQLILAQEENSPKEVFLQWKAVPGESYRVEWFDGSLHEQVVKASGLMIPISQDGLLKWRVKVEEQKRILAPWSEMQEVQITLIAPPVMPKNLAPEELELQSYSKENLDVELSWLSSSTVELELIGPKNDRTILHLNKTSHTLKVQDPGLYRWRLRSVDQFLRSSSWTEWKTFKVEDLSSEMNDEKIQRIQLKRPDQLVTFNWQAQEGSDSVFELSDNKEFSQTIIKKEVSSDQVSVTIPKTGNYYWRSRQFRKDGTFEVSEPKKVLIEPAPAPVKPKKLPDMEVPIQWQDTTTYSPSWWSFFISPAYADDLKGEVIIDLPLNEDAKQFAVRIYSDPQGENLIYEGVTQTKTFKWSDAKPGQYFWQYALIDFWERQSPFSDLSSLNVVGEEPIKPEKPKLLSPIRAAEVEGNDIQIKWTGSEKNKRYELQVSEDENFEKVLITKEVNENEVTLQDPKLEPTLYYWRIKARNNSKLETISNTGRFTVLAPLEKITIIDKKEEWQKTYSHRFSIAWAPSSDTYSFKGEEQKGNISGMTLNSVEARVLYFTQNYLFSGDLLRQSGKVFKQESYLFQRLQLHGTWKKKFGRHLWGPGLSLGSVSGYSYEAENDEVKSASVSGMIYGPHVQLFYSLNPLWEIQGRASYMLGAVPQMEITTEINRQMKNYYALFGLSYSLREYSVGEGSQSSLRLSLGLGKEF